MSEHIAGDTFSPTRAHANDFRADRFGDTRYVWRNDADIEHNHVRVVPWPMCSYCGSITPTDMIALMQTDGTRYSGSDWKYGFPHKFYIEAAIEPIEHYCIGATYQDGQMSDPLYDTKKHQHLKFYTEHMQDATSEQIEEWNAKVAPLLGVHFSSEKNGIHWHAAPGHQASGIVRVAK